MFAKPMTVAFGLLALTATAFADDKAAANDPVVATINGNDIRRTEVELVARSLPEQMRQVPMEQIYPMLLDRVIDFKLLEVEAEKQNIGDDPDVQPALEQARANVLRDAMLRNMTTDLLRHEKIRTTVAKAKAVRPVAERMITLGKKDTLHARRRAARWVRDPVVVRNSNFVGLASNANARIVENKIQCAVGGRDFIHNRLYTRRVPNIQLAGMGSFAQPIGRAPGCVKINVRHPHMRSPRDHRLRQGQPYT